MPRFTYSGPAEQVFPSYIDVDTGSTLVAKPNEKHDIRQVSGLTVPDGKGGMVEVKLPMPPNDDWSPCSSAMKSKETS